MHTYTCRLRCTLLLLLRDVTHWKDLQATGGAQDGCVGWWGGGGRMRQEIYLKTQGYLSIPLMPILTAT